MTLPVGRKNAIINTVFADIEEVLFRRRVEDAAIQMYLNGEDEASAKIRLASAVIERKINP